MKKIIMQTKKVFSCNASTRSNDLQLSSNVDVREEYANAFRTESYNEFWARVMTLTHKDYSVNWGSLGPTSASRLLSYRIFVEHLLEPDQPSIIKLLSLIQNQPQINKSLLTNYFDHTSNASILCGQLLKETDQLRISYKSLRKTLNSPCEMSQSNKYLSSPSMILSRLVEVTKSMNPLFVQSSSTLTRFQDVKSSCYELLKRLESRRNKVQAKVHLLNSLKFGSAMFLVAITTSITIIVLTHFIAVAMAVPGCFITAYHNNNSSSSSSSSSNGLTSTKQLAKMSAQLDAAAKGTYILNRDLDTISRLVARLDDELEHIRAMVLFWMDRVDDENLRAQAGEEMARQLKKNDTNFIDQLDELEEHLYLCFMTINRARKLVVKEILDLNCIYPK